jgi:hypothetical protein
VPRPWRSAALALAVTGIIHLVLAPEYLEEQAYIGVLFVLGGVAALVLTARLWKVDDARAWIVGSLVAGGMFVGFALSRTVGLPSFHESEWEVSGLVTLVLEAGFIAIAVNALRRGPAHDRSRSRVARRAPAPRAG